MITYILILIFLLPIAFLSSTIEELFTEEQLNEMGIRLICPAEE